MIDIVMIVIAVIVLIFIFVIVNKKKKKIKKGEKKEDRNFHEGQAKDTNFKS